MKTKSDLRRLTAALLSCILCCTGMAVPAFSAEETGELPARFDWREEAPEILTPVKTQIGSTCWAYATIACAESNLIRKGLADSSADLSESHLIWFTNGQGAPTDPDDPRSGGTHHEGIDGYSTEASVVSAAFSLAAWQGVIPERDAAPHADMQPLDESLRYQSAAHLQNTESYPLDAPGTVKQKLMEKGPMAVTYFNSHDKEDVISAQHGYYNQDFTDKKEQDSLNGGYHIVTLVGWDDGFAKENFITEPPADGAWIVRDSMEKHISAGNDYFYLSYYEPSVLTFYSYDFEPVTNYGNVYHYNDSHVTRFHPAKEENGYLIANVFEAKEAEKIAAVGFYTDVSPEAWQISVYALEPGFTNPQDGTLLEQFEGIAEYRGFHTVPLPQSHAVKPGQLYSAVIRLPIGKQYGTYLDSAVYRKGVSFRGLYNSEGVLKWNDCYDLGYGDVCLHVYTEYEGETEEFIRGDMNRDGKVNAVDLTLLKQVLLGSERTDIDRKAADWNGDNALNAEDAKGLLDFLVGIPEQGELKIKLTGSTAGKRDEAFRRQMQNAVLERVPDFDFSQFTFETNGMTYLHDKNDATEEIGKQFYFRIYYQDILLDPEQYELHIQQYYDGRFETNADFLTADMQEKLTEAVAAPRIAEADAVSAAREYAASLDLPDLPSVRYQPSERFGEKTALLVYSLAEGRLAYRVTDPLGNCYELGTGQSAVLCAAAADVYVDAVTGAVLENRFITTRSVS